MKVLIGVDGSAGALEAVRQAGQLISPTRDSIALYYVPPPARSTQAKRRGASADVVFKKARGALPAEFADNVQEIVGVTDPREGLHAAAEEWGADLIAVGARGLGAFKRWFLGSVSVATVHASRIPVLVARERAGRQPGAPLRLLLTSDSEEQSLQAAQWTHKFTWPRGTLGQVISVVQPELTDELPQWLGPAPRSADFEPMTHAWMREQEEDRKLRTAQITALCEQSPEPFKAGPPLILDGHPADEILEAIVSYHVDLVILGRRRGAVERWLTGSTSDKVLNHASCSVLIVPEPES